MSRRRKRRAKQNIARNRGDELPLRHRRNTNSTVLFFLCCIAMAAILLSNIAFGTPSRDWVRVEVASLAALSLIAVWLLGIRFLPVSNRRLLHQTGLSWGLDMMSADRFPIDVGGSSSGDIGDASGDGGDSDA